VDAGVLARQRVAKPIRAVRRAVVNDYYFDITQTLTRNRAGS
jgi:hypothetical protein